MMSPLILRNLSLELLIPTYSGFLLRSLTLRHHNRGLQYIIWLPDYGNLN